MLPFGGMVARAPEGETPLEYREAKWNYHLLGQWADPAEAQRNIDWVRAFDQSMGDYAEPGVYVNYVADPSEGALEAGFGPDNYARLAAIKREYDPENVFHNNSNIPPAG
jgi:FAD/FMN-containing dehydrogenase